MRPHYLATAVTVAVLAGGIAGAASAGTPKPARARAGPLPVLVATVGQSQEVRCPAGQLAVQFATGPLNWQCHPKGTTTTTGRPTTTVAPTTTPPTTAAPTTVTPTSAPPTTAAPTTVAPTTVAPTTTAPAGSWWVPGTGAIEWQWELDHALSLSSNSDMGYRETTYTGAPAPKPTVYDIDAIDNSASTVAALHALGAKVICYIEVGTAGNYYSAAQEGISTTYYAQLQAAGDLGTKLSGYPENFVNINAPSAVTILEAMIGQQCAAKGYDAVETDLDETFGGNEGNTGFTITQAQEVSFLSTLAGYMHHLGLAWIAKNPDDVGDASFSDAIEPFADGVITEQCNQYGTCPDLGSFLGNKAVFNAEYSGSPSTFCPADNAAGINGVLFNVALNGKVRTPCR